MSVKVLIADDHLIVCKGIESFVTKSVSDTKIEFASSIFQLKLILNENFFDLLILDVNFSDASLIDEIDNIKQLCIGSKIIVFTSAISYKDFNFLKSRVNAIVSKQTKADFFIKTVKDVLDSNEFFHSPMNDEKIEKLNLLSNRELDVLNAMIHGMGNKEIVSSLNIKESTVSTLRRRILEKLNLENNVDVINFFTETIL